MLLSGAIQTKYLYANLKWIQLNQYKVRSSVKAQLSFSNVSDSGLKFWSRIFLFKASLWSVTATRTVHGQVRQRHALNRLVFLCRISGQWAVSSMIANLTLRESHLIWLITNHLPITKKMNSLSRNCLTGSRYYLDNILICSWLNSWT